MTQAERKAAYLKSVEENGSPATARRVVGVTARCIKNWHDDLEFAAEVDDALAFYSDQIKLETVERARTSDPLQSQVYRGAMGGFGKSSTTINVSAVAQANAAASLSVMSDGELIDRLPEKIRLYVAHMIAEQLPMLIKADRKKIPSLRRLRWLDPIDDSVIDAMIDDPTAALVDGEPADVEDAVIVARLPAPKDRWADII